MFVQMTKLREFKDNILLLKSTDETRKGNLLQCIRSENETHAISRKCPIRIIKKATRVRIKLSNEWDTRRFDDWRQHEGVKYQKEKKKEIHMLTERTRIFIEGVKSRRWQREAAVCRKRKSERDKMCWSLPLRLDRKFMGREYTRGLARRWPRQTTR